MKWGLSLLLLSLLSFNAPAFSQAVPAFQPETANIEALQTALKNKSVTCQQIVLAYLERIKKYNLNTDTQAPINAFTEINPSVLVQAQALDNYYQKNQALIGPLHCVPVILKDNIDSFDNTTTAGSFALLGNQPVKDAFLAARLRQAGAIILGKGGMDEFAWGMFGISSRSGRIGNAYNSSKNPGGSSGGSAAAVSASFALVGIGTDNSGSVRIPAAFNGLVGLRPSTGLISQSGIFPMGNLDGAAGPMTTSVKDLAQVLDILAQADPSDTKTIQVPRVKTYLAFLNENGLKGKRIGIIRQVGKFDPFKNMPGPIKAIYQQAYQQMRDQGAILIDIQLPQFDSERKANQTGEIEDINAYLSAFPATRKNFADICESARTTTFGSIKKCLQFMNSITKKNSAKYQSVLEKFEKNKNYVHQQMKEKQLDALIIPISTQGGATYDPQTINTWLAPLASNAGLPAITFTIGQDSEQMPVGIEILAKQFDEGTLIEIAYAYERRAPARILPSLKESDISLSALSIPELNNLFSSLGKNAYEQVLEKLAPKVEWSTVMTAEAFRKIARETTLRYTGKR